MGGEKKIEIPIVEGVSKMLEFECFGQEL